MHRPTDKRRKDCRTKNGRTRFPSSLHFLPSSSDAAPAALLKLRRFGGVESRERSGEDKVGAWPLGVMTGSCSRKILFHCLSSMTSFPSPQGPLLFGVTT